ncbi:MAG: hypothetical protein PHV60_06910 [bacterium]|nr:hypothetical protein [bacterium]
MENNPAPDLAVDQAIRHFWLKLSIILAVLFAGITYFSLFGNWLVRSLGVEYTANWDPDGMYLASGLAFFDHKYVSYVGHPGISLMFLIQITARLMYWVYGIFHNNGSFAAYAATHIFWILFTIRMVMVSLFILAFYVLYKMSLVFLSRALSQIAVLVYASSFIILYYLNKISPEPILVISVLLTIYWSWRYLLNADNNKGYFFLFLTAVATAIALATKILIVAPLAVFIPVFILSRGELKPKKRILDVILYIFILFLVFAGLVPKVDWKYFIGFWLDYGPTGGRTSKGIIDVMTSALNGLAPRLWLPNLKDWKGLQNLVMWPFMILGIAGLCQYWRNNESKRNTIKWILIFLLMITPPVIYKAAYHYLVIHLAIAAIFAGYWIGTNVNSRMKGFSSQTKTWVAVSTVLVVNSLGLIMYADIKINESRDYNRWWKPNYKAINRLQPGQRIGLIMNTYRDDIPSRLMSYYYLKGSLLMKEFDNLFVVIKEPLELPELLKKNIGPILIYQQDGVKLKSIEGINVR